MGVGGSFCSSKNCRNFLCLSNVKSNPSQSPSTGKFLKNKKEFLSSLGHFCQLINISESLFKYFLWAYIHYFDITKLLYTFLKATLFCFCSKFFKEPPLDTCGSLELNLRAYGHVFFAMKTSHPCKIQRYYHQLV